MPPTISTRSLRREFGKTVALDDLDIAIEAGTITALVGPNGAGKTTFLRMLAGLLAPTSGSIEIFGRNIAAEPLAFRSRVGFLPDSFGLYEDLTPRQFLRYFARAYKLSPERVEPAIISALEEVDLAPKADEAAAGLSRGMKQRLGVARTLLHGPDLVLLDEPASGLDPVSRRSLQDLLKRRAANGTTILVSSHILSELGEYCDRVVILDGGRLAHSGRAASRRMRIRLNGPASVSLVTGRPGVSEPREDGYEIRFDFTGTEKDAARLLRELVVDGAEIVEYGRTPDDLQAQYQAVVDRRE